MSTENSTTLEITSRSIGGSRAIRRLRNQGRVPGVIYGGGKDPQLFDVDGRILRHTLAHAHAVLDVSVDGAKSAPVMIKDIQRHPVRGDAMHLDLLRVRLDQLIQAPVSIELVGADVAPGVVQGGVLSHETHQVQVEALPTDIPDSITFDVSTLELNATATLADVTAPSGVTLVDAPDTVIVTITPPTTEPVEEAIEEETEVVGEQAVQDAQEQEAADEASEEAS